MTMMHGAPHAQFPQTVNASREPGVLERLDNIVGSTRALQDKLESFGVRLAGNPSESGKGGAPPLPGIGGALTMAEGCLRECHMLVDAIHKAF